VWNIKNHTLLIIEKTKIEILMKVKILILSLIVVGVLASCRRQQCPAYGKIAPKATIDKIHA
jgi:hypothetical protein